MARVVREREEAWDGLTAYVQPEWRDAYPWLRQGLTGRDAEGAAGEAAPGADALLRRLRPALGLDRVVRLRQVHGSVTYVVGDGAREDAWGAGGAPLEGDALLTRAPGVGLAVFVADCVPVFLLDPGRRAGGVVHAGWRGTAARVLESALTRLEDAYGSRPAEVRIHLGTAIGGCCYEVGPEVLAALGRPAAGGKAHVDLRDLLEERALALGVPADQITRSPFCTRCDRDRFYSFRAEGARAGRMAAVLGFETPRGR